MAAIKSKKQENRIALPPLNIETLEVPIVGDTPLIVHAWSQKAKREMLNKHMKLPTGGKEAKNPVKDFEESLYKLDDGGYGFPAVAFKSAAITAVSSLNGLTKVESRQAFHVVGEDIDIEGAFERTRMRLNLVRIEGSEPTMREDLVRISMGKADIRYRGEFWPWYARLLIRVNPEVLSFGQIMNLMNRAGFGVGIGEWRPEKDGQNGLFHVATDNEIERLVEAP